MPVQAQFSTYPVVGRCACQALGAQLLIVLPPLPRPLVVLSHPLQLIFVRVVVVRPAVGVEAIDVNLSAEGTGKHLAPDERTRKNEDKNRKTLPQLRPQQGCIVDEA